MTASPDRAGHLRGVIENMLGYGTRFGRMSDARAAELRARVEEAVTDGTYLAVLPQWWAAAPGLDDARLGRPTGAILGRPGAHLTGAATATAAGSPAPVQAP